MHIWHHKKGSFEGDISTVYGFNSHTVEPAIWIRPNQCRKRFAKSLIHNSELLKLKQKKQFAMIKTRKIAVFTMVILAVLGSVFIIAWIEMLRPKYPADYGAMLWEGISITDVQFGSECMTIIVTNLPPEYCSVTVKITDVTVSNLNKNISAMIPVNETIPVDSQHSFRISYEWSFGSTYNLVLHSTRDGAFNFTVVAPAYTKQMEVI
jgi:hypothetical protein